MNTCTKLCRVRVYLSVFVHFSRVFTPVGEAWFAHLIHELCHFYPGSTQVMGSTAECQQDFSLRGRGHLPCVIHSLPQPLCSSCLCSWDALPSPVTCLPTSFLPLFRFQLGAPTQEAFPVSPDKIRPVCSSTAPALCSTSHSLYSV